MYLIYQYALVHYIRIFLYKDSIRKYCLLQYITALPNIVLFVFVCFCKLEAVDVEVVLLDFFRRNIFQRLRFLSFFPLLSFAMTVNWAVSVMVESEEGPNIIMC